MCGLLLVLLCLSIRLQIVFSQRCLTQCNTDVPDMWDSRLEASNIQSRSVQLMWSADDIFQDTQYVVQSRIKDTQTFTAQQEVISQVSFMLTNLQSSTEYDVRVCRAVQNSSLTDNCGNCVLCVQTLAAEEAPGAPQDVSVTSIGSETLLVTWNDSRITNIGISNYTVNCTAEEGVTSPDPRVVQYISPSMGSYLLSFINQPPNTSFTCSVTAFNNFGASPTVTSQGSTEPRTSGVPGALITYLNNTVRYIHVTAESITLSGLDIQDLFSTNDVINGMDYHFYRGWLYMTTTNGAMRAIKRLQMQVTTDEQRITLSTNSLPETLLTLQSDVEATSMTVDWINNEVYYLEISSLGQNRIMRSIVAADDSLSSPYCIVAFNEAVINIIVDPVHGFFYWGTSTGIFRTILSSVRTTSTNCPSNLMDTIAIITNPSISLFTIEPDEAIYFLGNYTCPVNSETNPAILSSSINIGGDIVFLFRFPSLPTGVELMDSFTLIPFVTIGNILAYYRTNFSQECTSTGLSGIIRQADSEILAMKMFRPTKQPLPDPPGPPTSVTITFSDTTATVSWSTPITVGALFSADAFSNWNYSIKLCVHDSRECSTSTTQLLWITYSELDSDTNYFVTISAIGLGGGERVTEELVFRTKADDFATAYLFVAAESGVQRSTLTGNDAIDVGGDLSRESNTVAYDTHTDTYYWAIVGGQANIFKSDTPSSTPSILYARRDEPFALDFDWVSRRLFWVEDGERPQDPLRVFVGSLSPADDPTINMYAEVDGLQASTVDAINGLYFWTDQTNIMMKTLSGLDLGVCHVPSIRATSLAVDAQRRYLFWLSGTENEDTLSINQMEYSSSGCETNSVDAKDLRDTSFSSSSTILAYGSNTLFLSNRGAGVIYTISSNFSIVGSGQTLAIGRVRFSGTATPITEIRDLVVTSPLLQSLPGNIDSSMRGLEMLTPDPPSSSPIMDPSSDTSNIVIRWGATFPLASVPTSPLFYKVDYFLERQSGDTITGSITSDTNTATLTGQQANTVVNVNVTTFSLWESSRTSVSGRFISLPDRPTRVSNIRAYVYRPTSQTTVTALVLWDRSDFALNYTVIVLSNGVEIPLLYRPPDDSTSYTVFTRDSFGRNTYPLQVGQTYVIQVFASNQAGNSEMSDNVTLVVNEPNYPNQVLSLDASGSQFVGDDTDINQDISISAPVPIAVDTIGRTVYWYIRSDNLTYSRSLTSGPVQPFLTIPGNEVILSMTFDWIGQMLYMLRVDMDTSRIRIFRVNIFDNEDVVDVFPDLQNTISDPDATTTTQLVMNPFTGFIYWTETSVSDGVTELLQLNLRDTGPMLATGIPAGSRRRRRRQSTLGAVTFSPALAQDPMTNNLLVSDTNTGNILSCEPAASMNCVILVNRDALVAASSGMQSIGLPATSIALSEQRIYWSNSNITGIFAVDLSAPNVLIMVSSTIMSSSISALSPGQQILPSIQECLSVQYSSFNRRARVVPDEAIRVRTNTTIFLTWTVSTTLPTSTFYDNPGMDCNGVVFSTPAPIYSITVQTGMVDLPELDGSTRRKNYLLENLVPHCTYDISLGVTNSYSIRDTDNQIFATQSSIQTLSGIPNPPDGLRGSVSGTASIFLEWNFPSKSKPNDVVRGNSTLFYIVLENGEVMTTEAVLNLTDSSLLRRGMTQPVQVIVNNGDLSGPPTTLVVRLWPLVPPPVVTVLRNTSLDVNVSLEDSTFFEGVALMACVEIDSLILPDGSCSCMNPNLEEQDFVPVDSNPFVMLFNILDLVSFTRYCVQAVGNYTTEVTGGVGAIIATSGGVPDAPYVIMPLVGSILNWTEPLNHGSPILRYVITARVSSNSDEPPITDIQVAVTSYDLSRANLVPKLTYNVFVSAVNAVGEGPHSNETSYTSIGDDPFTIPVIAGISVAGAATIAVILIVCIIVFFFQCRGSKRELRSLSYMYGPDHELNNLRDAHRNGQTSNPHYTWSREDYVCTDEDLNLLSKFPRNNLKLENFIDRGEFGEVFQGTATDILGHSTGPTPVAVKTLRKGTIIEEQRKFLSEAALMANFNHPNIVKVLGVCVDNDPVYIIMELMPGGDLLKFLREAKMDHGPTLLTLPEQIQIALDVAHGCHYLEQQHFIHRDIAARNCLVSSRGADRVVKIGDFGLAKDLYSSDYYQVEGQRKLPVRWMAPEALLQGKFTVESDIWSYGVLLWEIFTLGNQPYPGRINQEVLQFVTGGGRLDQPDKCSSRLYHLMINCWKRYASDRPHFEKILSVLNNYLDRLRRPDSVYNSDTESDEEGESPHQRQNSGKLPARTPSIRSGIMNLARSGSMKFRNSFRRHTSVHKREEHATNSQEDGGSAFRERGPF